VAALGDDPKQGDHVVVANGAKLDVLDPPALPALAPAAKPGEEAVVAAVDPRIRDVEVVNLGVRIEGLECGGPVLLHRRHEPSAHQLHVLVRHGALSIQHPAYPR